MLSILPANGRTSPERGYELRGGVTPYKVAKCYANLCKSENSDLRLSFDTMNGSGHASGTEPEEKIEFGVELPRISPIFGLYIYSK